MKEGALQLLGGSLLITAGVIWVLNFPKLPDFMGNALEPTAPDSASASRDFQRSYLGCFFRSSLSISAGSPTPGNYKCPLNGKLNLVTFGAFGLLVLGALVEGRRNRAKSMLPKSVLPESVLPESAPLQSALPESALPESALPESALPESALPEPRLQNGAAREPPARRLIMPPKDYVKRKPLRRSARKRRRW